MSVTLSTSAKPAATADGGYSSATGSLNGREVVRLSEEDKTSLVRGFLLSEEKVLVGEGSYSKVYSWTHKGKAYAPKPLAGKDKYSEREARIGPLLSHSNLAAQHGYVAVSEDLGYLIMDYVEGQDLSLMHIQNHFSIRGCDKSDRLRRWNNCKLLITQLRDAILYMHENCYMHRDIQFGNVRVVIENGELKQATLIDLGFVRHTETMDGLPPVGESIIRQKIRYSYCGALCNISPQVALRQHYTEKADVWGLGGVLYYLLLKKLYLSALQESPFDNCLPEMANDLLGKLLSKEEKDRPSLSEIVDHPFFATKEPEFP